MGAQLQLRKLHFIGAFTTDVMVHSCTLIGTLSGTGSRSEATTGVFLYKKEVVKNFAKFIEKTPAPESLFKKDTGVLPQFYYRRNSNKGVFL